MLDTTSADDGRLLLFRGARTSVEPGSDDFLSSLVLGLKVDLTADSKDAALFKTPEAAVSGLILPE